MPPGRHETTPIWRCCRAMWSICAAERIFSTVRYSSDGGVREDYSYLFHGHIPYAGAYGSGFAEAVARLLRLPRRSGDRHHACGLHRTPRGRTITRRLRVTPRRQEGPPHPRL
ncbi:MAG TPA: hypothetical protein DIC52_02020 [Candidatus Latescibacteria bacterium]|nr:hypothetical protein [Candidatus Latescibacterota bacterium]